MTKVSAFGAKSPESPMELIQIDRRALRDHDVQMEILYCGVCHSDLHQVRNDWGGTIYPCVPGHEIIGKVTAVGSKVTKHKVGEYGAIGCLVDSCRECDQCKKGNEQYCRPGGTFTYNGKDTVDGTVTMGGYSTHIVAPEHFVLNVPKGLDIKAAAPLLCAGITTWAPLAEYKIGKGSRVGVLGLGGLGHMAVKLAHALGAEVTLITRSASKGKDAKKLGASHVLISTDPKAMEESQNKFDLIIDTIPVQHGLDEYFPLLDIGGRIAMVGQIGEMDGFSTVPMIMGNRGVSASLIGGIEETQRMLNFCAEHNVLPLVEHIRMDQINEAFDRMERGDVHYRFVIDMSTMPKNNS